MMVGDTLVLHSTGYPIRSRSGSPPQSSTDADVHILLMELTGCVTRCLTLLAQISHPHLHDEWLDDAREQGVCHSNFNDFLGWYIIDF
jgi:hypothetical protein